MPFFRGAWPINISRTSHKRCSQTLLCSMNMQPLPQSCGPGVFSDGLASLQERGAWGHGPNPSVLTEARNALARLPACTLLHCGQRPWNASP